MNARSYISFGVLATLLLASCEGLGTSSAQGKEKPAKPLAGYSVINLEKFAVGAFSNKEGFPSDFAPVMQKLAVEKLISNKLFLNVTDVSESSPGSSPGDTAPTEEPGHRLIPQQSSDTTLAAELSDG